MTKVTDFDCLDKTGRPVRCDAFGNNVAFECFGCGHPVLAIVRENQRGSGAHHPATCPECEAGYWIEADPGDRVVQIHRIDS